MLELQIAHGMTGSEVDESSGKSKDSDRRDTPLHHDLIHFLESTLEGNADMAQEVIQALEESGELEAGKMYSMCCVDGDMFPYKEMEGEPITNMIDLGGKATPSNKFSPYEISHTYCRRHYDEAMEAMLNPVEKLPPKDYTLPKTPAFHALIHELESELTGNADLATEFVKKLEEADILLTDKPYTACYECGDVFPYNQTWGEPICNLVDLIGVNDLVGPFKKYDLNGGLCKTHRDEQMTEILKDSTL